MSELQLGLLAIGALVVVGVLAYNKLQERAVQRRAQQAFGSTHPDTLLDTEGAPADPVSAAAAVPEPSLPPAVPAAAASPPQPVSGARPAGQVTADARLDYIIEASGEPAVSARVILERWGAISHRFAGRAQFATGDAARPPGAVGDGAMAGHFQASLQLVSRAGVVGEAELIEFRAEMENLAAQLGWRATAPEMRAALEAARELDGFSAERDIQVALHVVSSASAGFSPARLQRLRERHALTVRPDGTWLQADPRDRPLFVVSDRSGGRLDATRAASDPVAGLSLAMDVPRAPDTGRSFESMARLATVAAAELGGTIVDDNGTALDARALAAIGAQVETVGAELEARGFAPGEPLALRLFG